MINPFRLTPRERGKERDSGHQSGRWMAARSDRCRRALLPVSAILLTLSLGAAHAAGDDRDGKSLLRPVDGRTTTGTSPQSASLANPFDAAAINNEAVSSFESGNYRRALALLERAARLAPHDTSIQQNYQRLRRWIEENEQQRENRENSSPRHPLSREPLQFESTAPETKLPAIPAPWQ